MTSSSRSTRTKALLDKLPPQLPSLNRAQCPKCDSSDTVRLGYSRSRGKSGYLCSNCRGVFHLNVVIIGKTAPEDD